MLGERREIIGNRKKKQDFQTSLYYYFCVMHNFSYVCSPTFFIIFVWRKSWKMNSIIIITIITIRKESDTVSLAREKEERFS